MFTRKQYKAIAEIVENNIEFTDPRNDIIFGEQLIDDLADYFATDNPRFDRDKFLAACGL